MNYNFPQTLPKFLNEPFHKYENDDGKKLYLQDLQTIASDLEQSLMVNSQGDIVKASKTTVLWENIKGAFGGINHTKKALVEYRFMRLLEYGVEKQWLPGDETDNFDTVLQIARGHFGLQSDKVKTIHKHMELSELIYIISVKTFKETDQKPLRSTLDKPLRSTLDKYVQHHKFDLEPHSVIIRLWHAFQRSLIPEKPSVHDLGEFKGPHDFTKFGRGRGLGAEEGDRGTQEEETEEEELKRPARVTGLVEEEQVETAPLPVDIGTHRGPEPTLRESSDTGVIQEREVTEVKTPEEEKADTEQYMEKGGGFSLLKIGGIATGIAVVGVGAAIAISSAPVTVPVVAAPIAATWLTPGTIAAATGVVAAVGFVSKKVFNLLRRKSEDKGAEIQEDEKQRTITEEKVVPALEGTLEQERDQTAEVSTAVPAEELETEAEEQVIEQQSEETTGEAQIAGDKPVEILSAATPEQVPVEIPSEEGKEEALGIEAPIQQEETPLTEIEVPIQQERTEEAQVVMAESPVEERLPQTPPSDEERLTSPTLSDEDRTTSPTTSDEDKMSEASLEDLSIITDEESIPEDSDQAELLRQQRAERRAQRIAERRAERAEVKQILESHKVSEIIDKGLTRLQAEEKLAEMRKLKKYLEKTKGKQIDLNKVHNFRITLTRPLQSYYSGNFVILEEINREMNFLEKMEKPPKTEQ